MDIRYAVHPEQMKTLDTKKMREHVSGGESL